jgi:predicted unusual protein kinase regulating ubiquinone biosynthesis (AarF/ABC1/UbiB family)
MLKRLKPDQSPQANKDDFELLGNISSAAAERLVKGLDELKGAAMKVGQMMSLEQDLLPAAWQTALSRLQSKSTPKPFEEIKPILLKSMGSLDAFESIDALALHAASMAQVHVGRLASTGEKVAIKVRYPGLREHVDTDLKALQKVLKVAGLIQREEEMKRILTKVREVFEQELDFRHELERTQRFAEQLSQENDIVTARPLPELCSESVLVTSWLDGVGIDDWLRAEQPSQAQRSRIGTLLVRCTLLEVFRFHHLQSDPNPANFLVLPGGKLGLVDFGASIDLPVSIITHYRNMAVASVDGDTATVIQAAEHIGFLKPTDSQAAQESFLKLIAMTSEPFSEAIYQWGSGNLAERIRDESMRFARLTLLRIPPEDLIFMNRRILGTAMTLEKLGPKVKGRALFDEIVRD